uniref:Putative nuclease HARBI1 n=1 Tax=Acrobeloides nanus TaxID=290746 RepID=A0A914CUZ7_9BILA
MDSSDSDEDLPRKRPKFNERKTYEDDPNTFRERYRFTHRLFDLLYEEVGDLLERVTGRNHALTGKQILLAALRFYASGHFYYSLGDTQGVSKNTICNAVKESTSAINKRLIQHIGWPLDQRELDGIGIQFQEKSVPGIPNICGALDGCHVNIISPSENEAQYVNRHHDHSINTMAVCGPKMDFYFISARWPGSVNDARVLRNSDLFRTFQTGWRPFPNAILIGDNIYPTLNWLVPMVPGVQGPRRQFYKNHTKTRSIIERSFGLWKNRFRCLQRIRVQEPVYACEIIKCTALLHNFMIRLRNDDENDDDDYLDEEDLEGEDSD